MKDEFAFLEYSNTTSAAKAISELNGSRICGCKITVEEAKLKEG